MNVINKATGYIKSSTKERMSISVTNHSSRQFTNKTVLFAGLYFLMTTPFPVNKNPFSPTSP